MYRVIIMKGANEPWWFFEDWQEDIIDSVDFEDVNEAKDYYQAKFNDFKKSYQYIRQKFDYSSAFWNEDDLFYCEDCVEYLQLYTGLMLVDMNNKIFENV